MAKQSGERTVKLSPCWNADVTRIPVKSTSGKQQMVTLQKGDIVRVSQNQFQQLVPHMVQRVIICDADGKMDWEGSVALVDESQREQKLRNAPQSIKDKHLPDPEAGKPEEDHEITAAEYDDGLSPIESED